MASSKEDVASQALARLGEPAISSFDEDSDAAEKVNQLYEETILDLLGRFDWNFAVAREELSEDGAKTPVNEWTRAFLMPAERTTRVGRPLSVFPSTALSSAQTFQYELQDKWIFTHHTTLVIRYVSRKPESQWPGYFVKLAVEALAAQLAMPICENQSKAEHHALLAFGTPAQGGEGGLFQVARKADIRGKPTATLLDQSDPIWSARFGGVA